MRTSHWRGESFVKKVDDCVTWTLEVEVLTPMFGGGVTVDGHKKPIDPITPIRLASIRGQLRFWWRAVNPQGCTTVEELRKAESNIFGAGSKGGQLDLRLVGTMPKATPYKVMEGSFGARQGHEGIAYGAFPLRDTTARKGTTPDHGVLHTIEKPFKLAVSFPKQTQEFNLERDLAAALWAWLNFGGLGGRTRRGFGAVWLKAGPAELSLSIDEGWNKFVMNVGQHEWPTLPASYGEAVRQVKSSRTDPLLALEDLLGRFRNLRQGEGIGRTRRENGSNTPGRSYWPEADSIRVLRNQSLPKHRARLTRTSEFPRAAFGTPIIFHFKDSGEPSDSTINPAGKGRLASPLILRPARTHDGLVVRALRLSHPPTSDGFELTWKGGRAGVSGTSLNPDVGLNGRPSPLVKGDFRTTDPIARFFKELEK